MLGLNIEAMAKSEIAKIEAKLKAIDADHDGLPDLAEVEKLVGEAVTEIKALEAKLSPADISAALNVLFPGKFSTADVTALETAAAQVVDAFVHLEGLAKAAATAL